MAALVGPACQRSVAKAIFPIAGAGEARNGGECGKLGVILIELDFCLRVQEGPIASGGASPDLIEQNIIRVIGGNASVLIHLAKLIL